MKNSKPAKSQNRPVVVTTLYQGVFYGLGPVSDAPTIRLINARMVVYWSANVKGVLGLASTGPLNGCKVGPIVPAIMLRDVTSVMECSEQAARAWESASWS